MCLHRSRKEQSLENNTDYLHLFGNSVTNIARIISSTEGDYIPLVVCGEVDFSSVFCM